MTATEKFNVVKRACHEQKICQVKFKDERIARFIHPLGICLTFNRGLVIVCCVEDTLDPARKNDATVSNLPIEDCHQIQITDKSFNVTSDFVTQTKICDDWLFHI
jgi:hypothetical protein